MVEKKLNAVADAAAYFAYAAFDERSDLRVDPMVVLVQRIEHLKRIQHTLLDFE